jgi:hypothetical protein
MVIIKRCILHYYFQLHVSAPSFEAILRLNYFLKTAMYTVDNTIIYFEISHYIFKILQKFAIFLICNARRWLRKELVGHSVILAQDSLDVRSVPTHSGRLVVFVRQHVRDYRKDLDIVSV